MQPYDSRNPWRPLSLGESKSLRVAQKLQEKEQKLNPEPPPSPVGDYLFQNTPGLLDLAQSSVAQSMGNLYDIGGDISNALFGTNIDTQQETGWSNRDLTDQEFGVTPEYRAELQAERDAVLKDYQEGNYGGALFGGFQAAPGVIADSTGPLADIALGTLATAAAPWAAGGIFGLRAGTAARSAKALAKTPHTMKAEGTALITAEQAAKIQAAREAAQIPMAKGLARKLIDPVVKSASQTSLLTADIVQQTRNEWRELYNEEMPTDQLAFSVAAIGVTSMLQGEVIKRLFLPSIGKFQAAAKNNFKDEMQAAVAHLQRGMVENIARRVVSGIGKVAAAGSGEGVQEYLQTWAEILSVHADVNDPKGLMQSIYEATTDPKNRDQAALGFFLGVGAGGTTRAVMDAPLTAVGITADVVQGAAKTVGNIAIDLGNRAALAALPEDQREELRTRYENEKVLTQEKIDFMEEAAKRVDAAADIDTLRADEELGVLLQKAQEELGFSDNDLTDPENLAKLKAKMLSGIRYSQAKWKVALESSALSRAAQKIGKNVGRAVENKAREIFKDVPVDKVLEAAKDLTDKAKTAISELESSTARGMVDAVVREAKYNTRDLVDAAKNLSENDLERVTAILSEKSPEVAKTLEKELQRLRRAQERFGMRNKRITDKDNVPKQINKMIEDGDIDPKNAAAASRVFEDILSGKVNDLESLEQVEKAFEVFKNSKAAKEGVPGASAANMSVLQRKMKRASDRIRKPLRSAFIKKMKNFDKALEEKGVIDYFKDLGAVERATKLLDTETAQDFVKRLKEILDKVPDFENKEEMAKFEKQMEEAFDKLGDRVKGKKNKEKAKAESKTEQTAEKETEISEDDELLLLLYKTLLTANKKITNAKSREVVLGAVEGIRSTLKEAGLYNYGDISRILSESFPNLIQDPEFMEELLHELVTEPVQKDPLDSAKGTHVDGKKSDDIFEDTLGGCKK